MANQSFRKIVRKHLFECMIDEFAMLGEERIPNDEARDYVERKENFIGSHIFGEQVGNSYVVCSYGEQFPIFIYDGESDTWYENVDDYIYDGVPQEQTREHKQMLRPTINTHTQSLNWMLDKLESLKSSVGIKELSHKSVEPGTKN